MQILTPVQDPNALHTKPYAGAAFRQCQQFLTPVQASNASHAKSLHVYRLPAIQIISHAREALQQLQHFLMRVQAPNASHLNPYACAGSQKFRKLLMPGKASNNSQANPDACTGSQRFTRKTLTLVQVPDNSDHSLCLGSLPTILKIPHTTKINSV
ncbi:hypothetical protein O181_052024 [Austropuccinia psidii MF-1]|uniref:Uncharacterized protein n=1 Tax=Austropuccinia psidii MF-1 TaxID=1389203 RepID=A0A9Q3DZX0_9BASI|nr:hypothetical protein [Austropuccinia psidii MF-1]